MWRSRCWRRGWVGREVLGTKVWREARKWRCRLLTVILGIVALLVLLLRRHFAPEMHAVTAKNKRLSTCCDKREEIVHTRLKSSLSADCCPSTPRIRPTQCQRSICWYSCLSWCHWAQDSYSPAGCVWRSSRCFRWDPLRPKHETSRVWRLYARAWCPLRYPREKNG